MLNFFSMSICNKTNKTYSTLQQKHNWYVHVFGRAFEPVHAKRYNLASHHFFWETHDESYGVLYRSSAYPPPLPHPHTHTHTHNRKFLHWCQIVHWDKLNENKKIIRIKKSESVRFCGNACHILKSDNTHSKSFISQPVFNLDK